MEQKEDIELQIWEYIDGLCNSSDQERIATLIETETIWHQTYLELSAVHEGLFQNMELEQPPLRFTKNIMEAVAKTQIAPATKKYINLKLIKGIAAFFIVLLVSMHVYAFVTAKWTAGNASFIHNLGLEKINPGSLVTGNAIKLAITINVILGLVFLDKLRQKNKGKHGLELKTN